MKLAISGKGGTGKSTFAAALSSLMAGKGWRVVAVDADPDGNLAAALGASDTEACKFVLPVNITTARTAAATAGTAAAVHHQRYLCFCLLLQVNILSSISLFCFSPGFILS